MNNLLVLYIIIPLAAVFIIPLLSRFNSKISGWLALSATAALALVTVLSGIALQTQKILIYKVGGWEAPIGINLVLDSFSFLFVTIISLIGLLVVIYSTAYINKYNSKNKYYILYLLMMTGMLGVVLTGDLFSMFVFIELAAISTYALVAFGGKAEEFEASFKYLILGTLASIMILLAIVMVYSITGSLNMAQAALSLAKLPQNQIAKLALALFIMGFGLKAALVPFHTWLPDAHTSSPAPISATLSGVLIKILGIYTLIRIIFNVFGFSPMISEILMALGILSMVVGGLLALGQWDMKRMLAYSSISQIGYIVFGFGIGTPLALSGAIFHLLNHAIFKPLLFMNAGAIEQSTGTRNLKDLGGLGKLMPVTFATSTVGALSISGMPPFNGFWSKLTIIFAAVLSGHYWYAFIAAVASIITLAYFLKIQKFVFLDEAKENIKNIKEAAPAMLAPMVILAAVCIITGIFYPVIIKTMVLPAVRIISQGLFYSRIIGG
jgi:multicomponent Na+:H+ antiporter subunit D